jgi:branched-chain amino acid transport system ATP-binding protein
VTQDVTVLLSERTVDFAFDPATRGYVIDTGSVVFEGSIEGLRDRDDLLEPVPRRFVGERGLSRTDRR